VTPTATIRSDTTALEVQRVVAGYPGAPPVLHDVSLTVEPGEIVAVLGRNGAGKTTLLRTISGMLKCRAGSVCLASRAVDDLTAARRARAGLAHVPEGRRVIPGMTVVDNLRLGGWVLRSRNAIDDQLEEVMNTIPALRGWHDRVAGSLSGGEQQMLALARALMSRPTVVLLDEPLTGLAPIFRSDVLAVVEAMRASGRAILLVEQNAAETLPIATRALVIHEGRITLSGLARELWADGAVQGKYLGLPVTDNPGIGTKRRRRRSDVDQ
jgi:branched-chain amino acid transport system ATP-binding protein